jgi:3-deoxy-D-manno-octulosonic acid (KDO) 8-phosphate synthase
MEVRDVLKTHKAVAEPLSKLAKELNFDFTFKASFDKASEQDYNASTNRRSRSVYRRSRAAQQRKLP